MSDHPDRIADIRELEDILDYLEDHLERMAPKERAFVEDMLENFEQGDYRPSEKQQAWLQDLSERY